MSSMKRIKVSVAGDDHGVVVIRVDGVQSGPVLPVLGDWSTTLVELAGDREPPVHGRTPFVVLHRVFEVEVFERGRAWLAEVGVVEFGPLLQHLRITAA